MKIDSLQILEIYEAINKQVADYDDLYYREMVKSFMRNGARMALIAVSDNPLDVLTICQKLEKYDLV